jgi:hypothetical protein
LPWIWGSRCTLLRFSSGFGEPRRHAAAVAHEEELALRVVDEEVHEGRRLAPGHELEQLHRERPVHVGLARADHRLLRPVGVVRVVEQGYGDASVHVAVAELGLALEPAEGEAPLPHDALEREVDADLPLQLLLGEDLAVVRDPPHPLGEPPEVPLDELLA